ncbi:MAG: ABC transporter permease [Chloroherpetonaceae bacterium]|nr:ABC transporter permease [Chthonomonadaceae bacterium]MDW8206242.1 ABC transporter permease [Chloroherpetonaceae bacterium]
MSPLLYVRRNPARTLPFVLVISLSVVMVASVVTVVNSIDLTVYTFYGYNRYVTGLTPRNALAVDEDIVREVRHLPQMGYLAGAHSYQVMLRTIFGRLIFPIFGLSPEARERLMRVCQVTVSEGRMLREGAAEAVVSEEVARNLGVKVGDNLLFPESEDRYAPVPVKLVGLLRGASWLGLTSKSFVDRHSPYTWQGYLAFARTPELQEELGREMEQRVDRSRARVWPFSYVVRETQLSLANLYLVLGVIISIVVFTISFVCGLLANIYFTQRLPEIATLSAIGYTRNLLLARAGMETVIYCMVGWGAGCVITIGVLTAIKATLITPRGLLLNPLDFSAYLFTVPLPITITLFALLTIACRLARLDPVSIIERRG